jgi:hypothetical protein
MADENPDMDQQKVERQDDYMKGGKGRTDDVRGSGIYPASAPDVPSDAETRTPSNFVQHKGPKPKGFTRAI